VDEKAQGTDGGTLTSGSWETRDLNLIDFDPQGIVSLAANEFTLQAGTYLVEWETPATKVYDYTSRLYNVTDASVQAVGHSAYSSALSGDFTVTYATGRAYFTIASAKAFRIETRVTTTRSTDGGGQASNFQAERYSSALIKKVKS
jgi:hypothetical protein